MDEMPSAEFRKAYAKLRKPTTVTVNGHPIGQWIPVGHAVWTELEATPGFNEELRQARSDLEAGKGTPFAEIRRESGVAQAQRDDLLRKINRGKK